jgi:hypothetical protein
VSGLTPGIAFKYFEGEWDSLPDFGTLAPLKQGRLGSFETPRMHPENYGFMYEGFVNVPARGVYTFFTDSDDGSRLFVDGTVVVDNDGLHGMAEKHGVVALEPGLHSLRVMYFNKTGGAGLEVSWCGPGFEKCSLSGNALSSR